MVVWHGHAPCRHDSADSPRKRSTAADRAPVKRQRSSSLPTDDGERMDTALQRHVETYNDFIVNIQVFFDGFRDLAMAEVAGGRIGAAVVNVRLKTIERQMRTELDRLTGMTVTANASTAVPGERDRGHVREGVTDGFHVSGSTRPEPTGGRPSLAQPADVHPSPVEKTADATGDDGLPGFLAALKPKNGGGKWCRGCDAPAFLVPAHWSDSFHRTLHVLRSAVPPLGFADGVRLARTVDVGRGPAYRVLSIESHRYDDGLVRRVREYVDAELGVTEIGVRRYERLVYLSVTGSRAVASVIGYLETEPVTRAHALGADGRLSPDQRRTVKRGVSRIWVAVGHRRRRVGTNMLDAFRADHGLRGRDVAFASHEIQCGDAFVRRYSAAAARSRDDEDAVVSIYTRSPAWYR